jgi:hypothetical protein
VIEMLKLTVKGEADPTGFPLRDGETYEEIELKSHRALIEKIHKLAKAKHVRLQKPKLPTTFLDLESYVNDLVNSPGFGYSWETNWDELLIE